MRRFILIAILTCLSFLQTMTVWSTIPCAFSERAVNALSEANDDWVLLGEITLSNYNQSSDTIIAKLYVREIAKKLIYRVEYHGELYATRWHDYSKTYHVTINGKTYRCDVPAFSNEEESDNKNSAKFVGKWKWGTVGSWYVDITYNEGKYSFNLNPAEVEEISEFQEVSNGIRFICIQKYDKRAELNRRGWKYYIDDRDNKAAPGYPTTGQYKYDREVVYVTRTITLTGSAPVHRVIMMHTYYYLDGYLTYEDIDTDFDAPGFTTELTKY